MRRTFIRALNSDLVKISSLNAVANVLKIAASVITNKVTAACLGPAGIALLGQFYNFSTIAASLASLGIGNGITKYAAEYRGENQKRVRLLSTGLYLSVLATAVVGLVIYVNRCYFADVVFQSRSFVAIFPLLAASLVLLTGNSFFLSLLSGYKEFNKVILINIVSSFFGLVISVWLTIKYLLFGALIGYILGQSLIFFVTLGWVARSGWWSWRECWRVFDLSIAKALVKFSCMAFTNVFASAFIQLRVRGYIIQTVSLTDAGYWQGILKLCDGYVMFVIATLGIYYLPRLSEIQTTRELRREVLKVFLFIMPVTIVSSAAMYGGRELIISWLFSDAFGPMKELFLFQLVGNVFRVAGWLLAYVLVAKAMISLFIISELACGVLFYVSTVYLVKAQGILGATHAYAITYACYALAMVVVYAVVFRHRETVGAEVLRGRADAPLG